MSRRNQRVGNRSNSVAKRQESNDDKPSVLWQAPLLNATGYADEGRSFITGLRSMGFLVAAIHAGYISEQYLQQLRDAPPKWISSLDLALRTELPVPDVNVVHAPGYLLRPRPGAQWNVGRTMFETDRLSADWVGRINDMDEVWVPSTFNVATFRSSGVTVPITVVPSGVDATAFRPGVRPLPLAGRRSLVFLGIFEWSYRKGWDVLLRAWAAAFTASDDVCLVLRCQMTAMDGEEHGSRLIDGQIDAFLREVVGCERSQVAPIILLTDRLAAGDVPKLYAAADAYVVPSRGEGWGRPYLEAMASGLPTVATAWSGNCDFMDTDNSLLVSVDRMVSIGEEMEVPSFRGHRWAEPSVGHLTELLVRLAADSQLRRRLGAAGRRDVEQRWQWRQVAAVAGKRLLAIHEEIGSAHRDLRGDLALPTTVVRWVGGIYGDESLAGVNRELCVRLAGRHGLQVLPHAPEWPPYIPVNEQRVRAALASQPTAAVGPVDVEVRHQWPPDFGPSTSPRLVVAQPWEYGSIPASWVESLNANADEVWCPTTWVRDVFVRDGIDAQRVHVVPYGTDTSFFSPSGPPLILRTEKTMRLLFVGGAIARKGIDLLLDAYLSEFSAAEDVCLVVKAFGAQGVYRNANMDARIAELAADPSLPEIELITESLSPLQIAALYRSCHALVHPYRGEGLGMPIIEAMASGLPVAVTGAGACLDFCDANNALLLPAREVLTMLNGLGPAVGEYSWFEPEMEALRNSMRAILTDRKSADERAVRARARVVDGYQWDAIAGQVASHLHALAGNLTSARSVPAEI